MQGKMEKRVTGQKAHWDSPDAIIKSLIASGCSLKVQSY